MHLVKLFRKLWSLKGFILYLPYTLFFNFKYLPFNQAVYLPIWLYKPKFIDLKGKLAINTENIKPGMIRLGENRQFNYPNNGIRIQILGTLEFNGRCTFGNDCNISVHKDAHLVIGDQVLASCSVTIICHYYTHIGDKVLIGWETKIIDTDFHQLKAETPKEAPKPYNPVYIGNGVWIAAQCLLMQGTSIPDNCVLAARLMTNRKYECTEHTILAGTPAKEVKHGYWHEMGDDTIIFDKLHP